MNKSQFEQLEESLYKRGYVKYNQKWRHEDFVIAKGFHKHDNKWEENRSAYQITLAVYDYTLHPEYYDRIPVIHRDHVGIEVRLSVSRTIDESLEMDFDWHDDTNIEELELFAEAFYEFICKKIPVPRKV